MRLKPGRASRLPEDFTLTPAMIDFAEKGGLNPGYEFAQFRDYHQSHGNTRLDWVATWRTWCRNANKWAAERRRG